MGRYSAIASLGQGGMANVYLALMSGPARFSKLLVLKVLREDLELDRHELIAMFLDEARLAARLQHRNIVQTYEFGEIGGRYYMAMEYLEGQSLRVVHRKLAPAGLPLAHELRILAEVARGLDHAHELTDFHGERLSVVHRDISPQNVFVTYGGEVKLLDFGIAKVDGAEHLTRLGVIKGKIDYIAPEQVRGDKIDRRADVFSLGAMLWEAISGQRFAGGRTVAEVAKVHKRLTAGEPKLRELKPDVPEELASIVDAAIALDPGDRIASAAVFAERIERYLGALAVKPDDRSLSALLSAAFQEERAALRQVVDSRIKLVRDKAAARVDAGAEPRAFEPGLTMSSVIDLSMPGTGPSALGTAPLPQAPVAVPNRLGRRKRLALLGAVSLALSAAVAVALSRAAPAAQRAAGAPPAMLAEPRPLSDAPAAPASASERTIRLEIDVAPQPARVTLDGIALSSNPFVGSFRLDGALHHLEASAEGCETVRQFIAFDADQKIQIGLPPSQAPSRPHLKRGAQSVPAHVAAPEPAAAPSATRTESAPSDELAPGTPLKTKASARGFDMNDPYAE